MDLNWTHALPFGLLMFAGSAIARVRRQRRQSQAGRNYPALAEQLGLTLEPPRYPGWAGRLRGTYRGHEVRVEPDERPRIVVNFARASGLELRSYEYWKRVPEDYVAFSFAKRSLNVRLPNRFCRLGLASREAQLQALTQPLDALFTSTEPLKQLILDSERLECLLDYGNPPQIPAPEVQRLLSLLVELALVVSAISEEAAP